MFRNTRKCFISVKHLLNAISDILSPELKKNRTPRGEVVVCMQRLTISSHGSGYCVKILLVKTVGSQPKDIRAKYRHRERKWCRLWVEDY